MHVHLWYPSLWGPWIEYESKLKNFYYWHFKVQQNFKKSDGHFALKNRCNCWNSYLDGQDEESNNSSRLKLTNALSMKRSMIDTLDYVPRYTKLYLMNCHNKKRSRQKQFLCALSFHCNEIYWHTRDRFSIIYALYSDT